jgi:hypothetical protein
MTTESVTHENEHCGHKHSHHHDNGGGAVYGLGFIGAAIYFIGQATTFWIGVLGFLKAIVWPVFLVLGLMKFLGL